ncbi:hypothetical protein GC170_16315 [bacterium]|nr:hypothetical protein [bacterium]
MSRRILVIISCLSLSAVPIKGAETQKTSQLLSHARERMADGSLDEAIQMMESALETAPAEDCKAIVEQLRKTYQVAIHQSRQAGHHDIADQYAQNLKLIDSVAGTGEPAEPPTTTIDATNRAIGSSPEVTAGIAVPKAAGKSDLAEPQALPEPGEVPPIATEEPRRPLASAPASTVSKLPEPQASANEPASKVRQFDIAEADDAFRARKYADAGHVYQQLLDSGSLPDSRRGHLAYCRAAALVERINKGPADAAEWNAIRQEIDAIQQIQPDFWFAEYLGDLVRERMSRTAGTGAKPSHEVASAGIMERTANQIRSMNPLRKVSR